MSQKLIVILGQTASGKTDLSIKLAKKFGGQIVSADSRQVYKGLDIGSGKVTKKEMAGIPHYLLDVASPKRKFTVAQFQKLALKKIKEIQNLPADEAGRNHVPFLVGGTGFYIQSVVDGMVLPEVKPNWKLRKELEKKSVAQLFLMLKKLDPVRAKNIDSKNPHRLIRAIEIVKETGRPVPHWKIKPSNSKNPNSLEVLQIGIKKSPTELKKLIQKRLQKRIKGIISEVKKLHRQGISFKRLEELGLEYRFVAQYIQGTITYQEMIDTLQKEIEHFAKRQMTWFKRDSRIHWIKTQQQAEKLIKKFIKKEARELISLRAPRAPIFCPWAAKAPISLHLQLS